MRENKVIAGIVTYNPDYLRLLENITAISKQVKDILIIDNGTDNFREFADKITDNMYCNIVFIFNKKNYGIAYALSQIMNYAKDNKYTWVLTLDQDSVIKQGLVDRYLFYAEKCKNVGMFTCLIKDRNFTDLKNEKQRKDLIDIDYCITSGAFTNVKKYFKTSGYDKKFFIDCVDFDICFLLKEKGYRICRINYLGLSHEVGCGENRKFFGKKIIIYHQKPKRIFYLTRNTIWMHKKHPANYSYILMLKKLISILIKIIIYEDNKKTKLQKYCQGIKLSKTWSG